MSQADQLEMSCRELVELVTEYLEGTLPSTERERFEEHLGSCPWCVNYLEQMKTTARTLGRLTQESISPEVRDALLDAFREWKRETRA